MISGSVPLNAAVMRRVRSDGPEWSREVRDLSARTYSLLGEGSPSPYGILSMSRFKK